VSDEAVVAGRRAVTEAIRAGAAKEVLISETPKTTPGLRELLDAAAAAQVPVHVAPRAKLDAMAPDHQGVVARVRDEAGIAASRELTDRDLSSFPFVEDAIVVVLDGITDPQNLGAAARSAEGAGAAMLITRTRRAAEVTSAAVRASAGALLHLPHARVVNISRTIQRLQEMDFWVVGLDGEAQASIYDEPCPRGRVALVIGGEGEGMARLTRERCDALVSLPMGGRVGSLNASASLAAALYGFVLPARHLAPTPAVDSVPDAGVAQSGSASDL
jgi:23S rRNA (guanosine2251-2'-O)-methyltransferase